MATYIYQIKGWPAFEWEQEKLTELLAAVRFQQGRRMGKMEALGFALQAEANLENLTLDVLKSSEIEGELLNSEEVRTSIAKKLGMDIGGLVAVDRNVEGVVEMMLDATQLYKTELTAERLFGWHAALLPTGRSGMHKIVTGAWRNNTTGDPMQVASGAMGKERLHYQAPDADQLEDEMKVFLKWFNSTVNIYPVLKAAVAHAWFVTIHPFDDGNGRIARAIADMQLARADNNHHPFYSMSAQIRKERNAYHDMLEHTQQNTLNITKWLQWFLQCLQRTLSATDQSLQSVMTKANFWEQHKETIFNKRQLLMLNKLLDGIEGKLSSSKWAKMATCSADTAIRDINDLVERRVFIKEAAGAGARLCIEPGVITQTIF